MALGSNCEAAEGATPQSGFLPDRIIHVHPTRLCNLACCHCYSDSGPQQRGGIDLPALLRAFPLLKAQGYLVMSLSGGEPLVYPSLRNLVEGAKDEGFRVTMVTNGLLATKQADTLLSKLEAVAISFDGLARTHNAVRGRVDAFERASSALKRLAENGLPVSAAVSVARETIPELPDLVDHLVSLGAKAIQIRPVARAGRAKSMADSSFYADPDQARLYLVTLALEQELGTKVRIHCDLVPARNLWAQRNKYSGLLATCSRSESDRPLADLVNPLVITDEGVFKPIAYDFESSFDITTVKSWSPDAVTDYKHTRVARLQSLIGCALGRLRDATGFVDWFDYCTRLSEKTDTRH